MRSTPSCATAVRDVSAPPVLAVRNLTTEFRVGGRWRAAVSDLSFDLHPGETLAIVGESGSGKSVTALSAMRLLPLANARARGAIALDGQDLLALPEPEMRGFRGNRISMIFQEPMTSLNPVLTIGFQIAETLRYHRGLDRRAAEAEALRQLERVRIPAARSRLHDYPHQFSGGMRQRVMIAMALACAPEVLIADEPTTALDVTVQAEILALMQELQRERGMAILFITHDMGVVAEIADRVLVMWRGAKVENDAVAQVFRAPRHGYTRALLGAVPRLGSMRDEPAPRTLPVLDPVSGKAIHTDRPGRAPAAGAPLLEVSGLTTRFPIASGVLRRVTAHVRAVENISFDLAPGETLALVGESGCGKSTAGRSILRLVEPAAGRIRFEGTDITRLPAPALRPFRARMQMIFQDPYASLDPRQTIGAAIAEPMRVHGIASGSTLDDRVRAVLGRVGLAPEMARRYPHEFSGGQRQRIAIARAIAMEPKLVVADEAVSALDVSIKAQVLNLLLELQADLGIAYLFISHDMAVVERISHRVAVMYAGELVEIGARADIIENPQHPYTRRLIEAVPIPDPAVRRQRRATEAHDLPSPVRAVDYQAPPRIWRTVATGHLVQEPA
jgi:peptide/nickel transport system ATP-binding protein